MATIEGAEDSPTTTSNTRHEHNEPKPKWSDPQWWSVGVNGLIALTTLGTLLFLSAQIRAIRNIERAILVPKWEQFVHMGFIRYDDMFGKHHETRYGLRYHAEPSFSSQYDNWFVDGPKKYNGYK